MHRLKIEFYRKRFFFEVILSLFFFPSCLLLEPSCSSHIKDKLIISTDPSIFLFLFLFARYIGR